MINLNKRLSRYKKYILNSSILSTIVLATACHQAEQIPPGSSVTLSPTEKSIEVVELTDENGLCLFDENYYQDSPLLITVNDAQGAPIGDVEVSVYVDYSANTFSGRDVLKLYADRNGNGVVDDPDELVSGADDDIFRTKTGLYNGELFLLLRVNLSCAYRGQVFAYTGSASGAMNVEIKDPSGAGG